MKQDIHLSEDKFKLLIMAALVVLVAGFAWVVYRVEQLSSQVAEVTPAASKTDATSADANGGWRTTFTSGKGAFSLRLPDGWGPVIKPMDSDALIMLGMTQPIIKTGNETKVQETNGYGSDSPMLFMVQVLDKGAPTPRGEASEFSFGKGEEAVTGAKYSYRYDTDDLVGIGILRLQGDREYEYVFPYGDKEVHVFYNVYGVDPRNNIVAVDEIVRSLTLKQ